LNDLGIRGFLGHLNSALENAFGEEIPISPGTMQLLEEFFEEGLFDMDSINTMVRAVAQSGDRRLMDEHFLPTIEARMMTKRASSHAQKRVWTIEDFDQKGIIQKTGKSKQQYFLLFLGLQRAGDLVGPGEICEYMVSEHVPVDIRWSDVDIEDPAINKRVSSAVNRLRKKVNEHPECGWKFGSPHMKLLRL